MPLEFVFAPSDKADWQTLQQGDVLQREGGIVEVLRNSHQYYALAEDYHFFLVLTQSCDLVRRGSRPPNSRYITLAAVRPASVVINRAIQKYLWNDIELPVAVCVKAEEHRAKGLLERLLHNTEDEYLFLKGGSHPGIGQDLCAFLRLSIALRAEHYEVCLASKVAQLSDIFQAKLGWLVGNIYSRVGTPDIEELEPDPVAFKEQFLKENLESRSVWLNSMQVSALRKRMRVWQREHAGQEIDEATAIDLLSGLPDEMETLADRVISRLRGNGLMKPDEASVGAARNILANDRILRALLGRLGD